MVAGELAPLVGVPPAGGNSTWNVGIGHLPPGASPQRERCSGTSQALTSGVLGRPAEWRGSVPVAHVGDAAAVG